MRKKIEIELLAPAGSYEAMLAAIQAGSDAVYIGGSRFGARAYANNLDTDMMCQAIDTVHVYGKKLYLTVNTLLKQQELYGELYEYIKPFYECGLDAVIVQDYGVFQFIRKHFPDLPIHASTQMTITGPLGAAMLEEAGATRVVTARELSSADIAAIRAYTDLEIESFVHGALCYCYSGQCLFSSMIGGRSGNRGRCAQPCRQPYETYEFGEKINNKKAAYPLSTKDMCTIEILPEIIEAGVTSLKIEGRMKRPEYAAGVVSIYRKYLDLYLEGKRNYRVEKKDLQILYDLFQRDGFNQSYYNTAKGPQMMALQNKKNEDGRKDLHEVRRKEKTYQDILEAYLNTKKQVKINGSFTIYSDSPAILTVYLGDVSATVSCDDAIKAEKRPLTREIITKQLKKTGGSYYRFDELEIFMGDDVFIPLQKLNELRREALQNLTEELLSCHRRKAESFQSGNMINAREQEIGSYSVRKENMIPPIRISVETKEQLDAVLSMGEAEGIYLGYNLFQKKSDNWIAQMEEAVLRIHRANMKVWIALPHVWRMRQTKEEDKFFECCPSWNVDGYLVRNAESFCYLESLGRASEVILDYSMYIWNSEASDFWNNKKIQGDTIPYELNAKEIQKRDNHRSDMLIYGRVPMMISEQCVKQNLDSCTKSQSSLILKDKIQAKFPVQCCCNTCYNVIYNSVPLSLLQDLDFIKKLDCGSWRMAFTTENQKETKTVLQAMSLAVSGKTSKLNWPVTRGHFKRSVE